MKWSMKSTIAGAVLLMLAACAGNPWPDAHSSGSVQVTLMGDSLLLQSARFLGGALAWDGVTAHVTNAAAGSTGLLDDRIMPKIEARIDAVPVGTVVVFEWSGNCFWGPGGGCPFVPGSPEFFAMWRANMVELTEHAKARGLIVLWAKAPPFGPNAGGHAGTAAGVSSLTEQVAAQEGVELIDWGAAVSGIDGSYQRVLWYADAFSDPQWHTVRSNDDIHFVDDGAKRASAWSAAGVIAAVQP